MMCPCISSKSEYATCGKSEEGLFSPSTSDRERFCFDLYELCPLFSSFPITEEEGEACLEPSLSI